MPEKVNPDPVQPSAKSYAGLIAGTSGSLSTAGLAIAQAPGWAIGISIVVTLACSLVGLVFPQESAHRLDWWKALWSHRQASKKPPANPPP